MNNFEHTCLNIALFIWCVIIAVALCVTDVFPAEPPVFTNYTDISNELPADIVVDRYGRIFVAEASKNRVTVYNSNGEYIGKIDTTFPFCVAVDSNQRIFVGSKTGTVSIYDRKGDFISILGNFSRPSAITVDSLDRIYVLDNIDNLVKIFKSDGTSIGFINQVHHPVGIAIDNIHQEIVVVDKKQRKDSITGTNIDGAGVSWFSMDGTLKRTYDIFGYNGTGSGTYDYAKGQMVMPNKVTIDSQSRIYITGGRLQKVMVYDNMNNWLAIMDSGPTPLRTPLGIYMSITNRLYVSSLLTDKIEIFGIDNYESLAYEAIPNDGGFGSPKCDKNNLNNCSTEQECESIGMYWYSDICNIQPPEPECDADHLWLCEDEFSCTLAIGYWYNDTCYAEPQPIEEKDNFPWILFHKIGQKNINIGR